MKFFNIALLALLAPASSAFARYEVHSRTEKIDVPFTITLPYPAAWKMAVGYEDSRIAKPAIFLEYPQPTISFQQDLCKLSSNATEKYGMKSCTFTTHIKGKATITFSLPHKSENADIPDNVVIRYQIDIQE